MKYELVAEGRDSFFTIWEGNKAPTSGDAYFALLKAELLGLFFPQAKAYRGKKFLKDFNATEINELVRSKMRVVTI